MGRNDYSLDEIELDEKHNRVRDRKLHPDIIKKGYSHLKEKFSGRRSGSGKIVLEFYDDLVKLWGGSPATESLTCGISSEDINLPSCSSTVTIELLRLHLFHKNPSKEKKSKKTIWVSVLLKDFLWNLHY